MRKTLVKISKDAEKQIMNLPIHIQEAARSWILQVNTEGIDKVRRFPGYRDKSLRGDRYGQRCIRLNRAYRLFYREFKEEIIIVLILEVNKHEY